MNFKIAVVIVTYNRLSFLKDCIEAIKTQSAAYHNLIIVNNGSTDGTTDWLITQDGLQLVHQQNVGSAGGFYTGVKTAYELGADYIWMMDDDVIPDKNALQELLNGATIVGDFSFVCSKVVSKNDIFINAPNINLSLSAYQYPVWGQYAEQGIIGVKNTTFVSVMVNSKHLPKAGYPNKNFFIWGDDIDFTSRLSQQAPGYLIAKSKATHLRVDPSFPSILTETNPGRIKMHYFNVRNNLYVSRRYKKKSVLLMDSLYNFKIIVKSLSTPKGLQKARIYVKGFWSGLLFNPIVEHPNKF